MKLEAQVAAGADRSGVSAALSDERRKLLVVDEAYQAEFARIESTLRRAGLTQKELDKRVAIWHDFTAHYRQRMDASLAEFDRLSRGSASRQEIAALRAGLGAPALSPNRQQLPSAPSTSARLNLPPRQADVLTPATGPDLPTPDDLAQTSVVQLSPDIRALAAKLGNSPAALYAYVYNNIRWVPYLLSYQNSEAVLWSGRGNDADQSTLLIALLRAANIPARYVTATINIATADAINWVGAKDEPGAYIILGGASAVTEMGDQFQIMHTWVEAWVNNGAGPAWIDISPSLKTQTFQPGLPLNIPVFDRAQFLSAPTTRLATDIYADQIHAGLAQSFPGHNYNELGYTGTIVPVTADSLTPFPYTPVQIFTKAAALPQTSEWQRTVTLYSTSPKVTYLSSTFYLPEVSLQSLTIGYIAATPADQQVIDSYGGIGNTPAGVANLLAQLCFNGVVVATSTTPVPVLQFLYLADSVTVPNATTPYGTAVYYTESGASNALVMVGPDVSYTWIGSSIDSILANLPTASLDSTLQATLFLAGLLHAQEVQETWASIFVPLQYASDYALHYPFGTFVYGSPAITPLFDRPFLATAIDFSMSDGYDPPHPFNLNTPEFPGTVADISPFQVADSTRSQSECRSFERIALETSACTVSGLQTASQDNIPLLVINNTNAAQLLPTITQLPLYLLSYFQGIVPYGTVTIPNQPVRVGTWDGFPWILDWDYYYTNAFFGLDQLNGGETTGDGPPMPVTDNPGPTGNPTPVNGTTCSDPVTVSNGNMFQQQTDLAISSRGPALLLARTYNSFAAPNNGPFGYGWTHSYATYLKNNGSTVTMVDGSGGVYTFTLQGGAYVSPAGLDLKLTKDAQGYTITTKHDTQSRFNTKGLLQSITDRNQNTMKLGYDSFARLTTITDALNHTVTLSYNASNQISSAKDFSGRRVTYSYDAAGDLTSVTDPAGNVTQYSYYAGDFAHLLQTVTKPAGNSTSFEYYVNRQTARISDSAGRNMRFLYLPLDNQTIFIDARGFASSYYFDALGEVTRVVKSDGTYIDTTFTADAKVASVTDENGYVTAYTYDALGNMTSSVDALGRTVTMVYEPDFNMLTSLTDPLKNVIKLEYDAHGNLLQVMRPLGVEARFVYDGFGDTTSVTDPQGNTSHIVYDSNGDPVTFTDPLGHATHFTFDQLRRLVSTANALGDTSTFQFDVLNRLTKLADPLKHSFSAAYDPNSNLAQTIDQNGNSTRFSYDMLDQLAQVTDAKAGVTQYGYSVPGCGCTADSDLINYQNAAGETSSQTYDFNHWLMQAANAAGASSSFIYDSRGDLIQRTDANGNTVTFQYDAVRRLTNKTFPDGTGASFSYDANGNLTAATNANTSITYTYDDLNRVTSVTDSRFGNTIRYTYNGNGLRTALTDSEGGVTSYTYDAASNLKTVTNTSGGSIELTYDALNRPSTLAYSNGVDESVSYDAVGRVKAISAHTLKAAGTPLNEFSYFYSDNGLPLAIADLTGTSSFQFDDLNRLTAAKHPTLAAESYSYDSAGNRTASAKEQYTYDNLFRLTKADGVAYSYDANGNLTSSADSKGTTTYTYDYDNQITGIKFPNGTTAAYLYDAFGRRIQKKVNASVTNYLYDGANILLEVNSGGVMQARYTHGPGVDNPWMMERGGQTYFYHTDAMGSIAAVTNSSGKKVCSYLYDSFGSTQACPGLTTPYGFAGREYDAESGLYYMRARHYDPATGRFLRPDPLDLTGRLLTGWTSAMFQPQQLNRYSYAVNNPLVFRDPSGLGCTALQAFQVLNNVLGNTVTQNVLDSLAQTNPEQLRQIRDTLVNANVSSDLQSYKYNVVVSLNIALIGAPASNPTPAADTTAQTSSPYTLQQRQQAAQAVNAISATFGGPPVPQP
jgi:RHS repeat-associated protein